MVNNQDRWPDGTYEQMYKKIVVGATHTLSPDDNNNRQNDFYSVNVL